MASLKTNVSEKGSSPESLPVGYVPRLVGLLGMGVFVCWWLSRYTDVFPEVASLLALGGIFSWIAVAFQLLPEDRVKALQEVLDKAVLCNARTTRWGGGTAVVLIALANSYGAIRLESAPGEAPTVVVVERLPQGGTEECTVASGEGLTLPVRAFWWRPASLQVRVFGFPDHFVSVYPWNREVLSIPQSFQRTVILLRPTAQLYNDIHNNPMELRIGRDGLEKSKEFDGTPVWLSSDANLMVPGELRTGWSATLSPTESARLVHAWSKPKAFYDERQEAPPGTEFMIQLYYRNKSPCYPEPRKITVFDLSKNRRFVQEEVLDACP